MTVFAVSLSLTLPDYFSHTKKKKKLPKIEAKPAILNSEFYNAETKLNRPHSSSSSRVTKIFRGRNSISKCY